MRNKGLGFLQALADLNSTGQKGFFGLLVNHIDFSRDNQRRAFDAQFGHSGTHPFDSFSIEYVAVLTKVRGLVRRITIYILQESSNSIEEKTRERRYPLRDNAFSCFFRTG